MILNTLLMPMCHALFPSSIVGTNRASLQQLCHRHTERPRQCIDRAERGILASGF
jgi:hypothetical protein